MNKQVAVYAQTIFAVKQLQ